MYIRKQFLNPDGIAVYSDDDNNCMQWLMCVCGGGVRLEDEDKLYTCYSDVWHP